MRRLNRMAAIRGLERRLAAAPGDWHPMSPWWLETLERGEGRRQFVGRVGRQGGKSSTLVRVAVAEALPELFAPEACDPWRASSDTKLTFAIVSASREQATDRISSIKAILKALNIPCSPRANDVEIDKRNIRFCVYTASIAGVSGFSAIGVICDEVTKWKDSETGSNPAREVLASIRPTLITQPDARIYMISSPWSTLDEHYKAYEVGNNDMQWTAHAPSWVANPTLSEIGTRNLEPDEEVWMREYAAIPMASTAKAFFHTQRLTESVRDHNYSDTVIYTARAIGADFAFRRDASAAVCAELRGDEIWLVGAWERRPLDGPLKPSATIREAGQFCDGWSVDTVMADLVYSETVREHLDEFKIELRDCPPGQDGVTSTHLATRAVLNADKLRIAVPGELGKRLLRQLQETTGVPTTTGLRITHPDLPGSHGDLASAAVLAVYQLTEGLGNSFHQETIARVVSGPESARGPEWHDVCPDSE